MQMGSDRADRHSHRLADLIDRQFFRKLQQENSSLIMGKCFKHLGELRNFFSRQQKAFRIQSRGRNQRSHLLHINCRGLHLPPELIFFCPQVVAHHIDRDACQPRLDAALRAKFSPAIIGSQQCILSYRLGQIRIACRVCGKAKNPGPMRSRQRVNIVKLANGPAPPRQA